MLFQAGLGINIETTFLSMAYLKASFQGVQLEGHATYDLPVETTVEERLETARGLILAFVRDNHIPPTDIYLSIPRDLALLRYIELPLAVKENLREALGYEMEKYTPFSADDVYFDCRILSEDKEAGTMKVLLVAAEKDTIGPYINLCQGLEMGVSGMEISSTALAGCLSHSGVLGKGRSSVVVYMAGGRMEVDLLRDNLLWYSRYLEMAEDGGDIPGVIRREVALLGEIQDEGKEKPHILFLAPPMDEAFFIPSDGDDSFEIHRPDLSSMRIPSHELVPAYGCALKAIRKVWMDVNLLPVELRKKPDRRGYYTMLFLGGLLVLSLISWGGGTVVRERLDLKRLDTKIEQLKAEVSRVEKIRARCTELEGQIDYLNKLIKTDSVSILDILRDLSGTIPESAWVDSFTVSDEDVRIEGYADSASELITLLEESPLFSDVVFLSTITKTRDGKERFRIGLKARQSG